MANKTLNTRIKLKYDSYANWSNVATEGVGGNLVLEPGEVAICYGVNVAGTGSGATTKIKIGALDGSNQKQAFKDLPWFAANADDVSAWAKASTKPTYARSEITDLKDAEYRLVEVTSNNVVTGYKLQYKDITQTTWTDVVGDEPGATPVIVDVKGIAEAAIAAASGVSIASLVDGKIPLSQLPDAILGQVVYGGTVTTDAYATLSTNAKTKLGTTSNNITLTNDTTAVTGYVANEGIYYIADTDFTFAGLSINTGDWLISTGTAWKKIDNTDAVTGIKGNAESDYRIGNVNLTPANIGAIAGVKVNGTALTPDQDQVVNVVIDPLVPATPTTLGGVKIGDGLKYDGDSKISTFDSIDAVNTWILNDQKYRNVAVNPYNTDTEDLDEALDNLSYTETIGTAANAGAILVAGTYWHNGDSYPSKPLIIALDLSKFGGQGKVIIASSLEGNLPEQGVIGDQTMRVKLLYSQVDDATNRGILTLFAPQYATAATGSLVGFIEKSFNSADIRPSFYSRTANNYFVCTYISNVQIFSSTFVPFVSTQNLEELMNYKLNTLYVGTSNNYIGFEVDKGRIYLNQIPQETIFQNTGEVLILDCGASGVSNS